MELGYQKAKFESDGKIILIKDGAPYPYHMCHGRFGKSLFIDTLQDIFQGKQTLFKGLAVHD